MPVDKDHELKTLVVKKIIRETANTKSFVLQLKDDTDEPLTYKAGQFLTFIYHNSAGEEKRRNYSISSAPLPGNELAITVKRIDNGEFSRRLVDHTRVGDELITLGASGFFVLPENISPFNQLFFIVAGSGITPAYSLIKTILVQYPLMSIVLIYSNTSIATTIFYEELVELGKAHSDRLKIEFLFSTDSNLLRARLNTNLLAGLIKNHQLQTKEKALFYVCGPTDYMRMIVIYLNIQQIPAAHIKREIFNVEKLVRRPQPQDKDPHTITIQINQHQYQFITQYPSTILQTAKQHGIKLPFSCESGQCGTCAVKCISGKVWMYNNEVLTDDELDKGIVLTCTGYAIDGEVKLEMWPPVPQRGNLD
ncbi:MAG: ferredoxin--NADP reductase [Ferruginibacter sp.]